MKPTTIKKSLVSVLADAIIWFVNSGCFFYATLIAAFAGVFLIRSDLMAVLSIIGWIFVNERAYTLLDVYVMEPRRDKIQSEANGSVTGSLVRQV